jgi:hypothetical protein
MMLTTMKRAIVTFLVALAANAAGQQVRVTVQVIEVPHGELTKWTTGVKLSGAELHDRALKLALGGGAEILDTNIVVVRNTEKALTESICEMIYPVEPEPSNRGGAGLRSQPPPDFKGSYPPLMRPFVFGSFATRNTGSTVEIEPTVSPDHRLVDLRLAYEMVDRASLMTWMEYRDELGDGSIRQPIFDTRRLTSSITLVAGRFELFNVFTPKPPAVPAVATRQLVFVKADIISPPKP